MPKRVATFTYIKGVNGYITDTAEPISISRRVHFPPDVTDTQLNEIAIASGATLIAPPVVCEENPGASNPRYLNFIRESGNSVSIPLGNRTALLTLAGQVKGILDQDAGNKVVCIELYGEYFRNLNDQFGINYTGTVFAKSHASPIGAPKQYYYTGTINYDADAATTVGAGKTVRIRSISDVEDGPATQIAAEFDQCTGGFLNVTSCPKGRRKERQHRRYLLSFFTKSDPDVTVELPKLETIEMPVKDFTGTSISGCGENLASLPGLFCLGYRGESFKRVHTLLE
jgi:hypothetical protein